jgi:PTS system beta-glucosides-specific IIC component
MYGVMAGGAVGGVIAGALGCRAYVMGYSTILALPIFETSMIAMLGAIIAAIVVSCAVTFILGFDE